MTRRRRNPDQQSARELELYVDNDGTLYRQQGLPILKNLALKKAKGVYNRAGAVKLYGHYMTNGAKKYAREYASPGDWNTMFSVATRKQAAESFVDNFESEYDNGNYDNLLPKKYQQARQQNPAAAGIGSKAVLCRVKRVGNKLHITKVGR